LRSENLKRRPITVKGLFICLLAASLAASALPNDAAAADCTDRASLPATPDGEAVAAVGFAYVRSIDNGSQQTFVVQVAVDVPDGTQLLVFANGGDPAGTITVAVGTGTLMLSSPLPAGLAEVCEIGRIWVTDVEETITLIDGSF
jgi:hypothetical protein